MKFMYWNEGLVLIAGALIIIGGPCIATAIIGTKLIDSLGQWPSKHWRLQMNAFVPLLITEIITCIFLVAAFKILSSSQ